MTHKTMLAVLAACWDLSPAKAGVVARTARAARASMVFIFMSPKKADESFSRCGQVASVRRRVTGSQRGFRPGLQARMPQ